ncbi:MAG: ATP-binding cassette domain-containing protein, partial [Firmicutes bacterium]|nr:ATP-binding cassette domain-containing protein [Bacillota bacterium]
MIDFKNVTKVYADTVALKNATLHIDQGDFVFVVGPTGSGKSTFIKLITKEIEPDEGEVSVEGKPLSKMSNRDVAFLRRDIGMVFQDFKLLENK